jgi:hypothetical protein
LTTGQSTNDGYSALELYHHHHHNSPPKQQHRAIHGLHLPASSSSSSSSVDQADQASDAVDEYEVGGQMAIGSDVIRRMVSSSSSSLLGSRSNYKISVNLSFVVWLSFVVRQLIVCW